MPSTPASTLLLLKTLKTLDITLSKPTIQLNKTINKQLKYYPLKTKLLINITKFKSNQTYNFIVQTSQRKFITHPKIRNNKQLSQKHLKKRFFKFN